MSVVDSWQGVALHTHSPRSVQIHQFLPEDQESLLWTRELRETSRCELVVPTVPEVNARSMIVPWSHWISVFNSTDSETPYWTGPVVYADGDNDIVNVTAMDVMVFAKATAVPISKSWETTDPADIAAELFSYVARQHNLRVRPVVRRDPEGDPIDFEVKQDEQDVLSVIDQLARLGLYWTVVSGVPLFGPASTRSIVTLSEQDFAEGGLKWVRDGRESFNEVLVRGADNLARREVYMGGQHLQKIVTIDDMFGVGNVERAAEQHVRQTGFIRDAITVPGGAQLHPDAPVDIAHLIPSARFNVEAFGFLHRTELENLEVRGTPGAATAGVNLESIRTRTELGDAADNRTGGTSEQQ